MRVTPEAVRLARKLGTSPIRLARWLERYEHWILYGRPLKSGEPRGILNNPSPQQPPK